MYLTFDPLKNDRNVQERGLTFIRLSELDWATAYFVEDKRREHGERPFRVLGCISERLPAAVLTPRADKLHVISLRKAKSIEVKLYEKGLQS